MKYLILSLSIYFFSPLNQTIAQGPTNANKYNYTVFSTGYYYKPDTKNGTNYPTFLLRSELDGVVSSPGALLGTRGENAEYNRYWDADTPSRIESGWRQILKAYGNSATTQSYFDYEAVAYDNTCGDRAVWNSYCFPTSSDGTTYYINNRLYGRNGETGSYYNTWQRGSNIEVRFHTTWRYYNGEGQGRPLTFGTIPSGGYKSHTNYNRAAPANIADHHSGAGELGYVNNWSSSANAAFSNSPDVTYAFTIDQLSTVDINTNYGTTNYDSKIHIVKDGTGSSWELLESNDAANSTTDKARITRVLEPGNYFVVVEGNGNSTGKFYLRIDVDAESFVAGSIAHPMPWVQNGCNITEAASSTTEATNSFGETMTYDWLIYKYVTNNNNGQIIQTIDEITLHDAGLTLEPDELGPIQDSAIVKRIARTAYLERVTDPITIVSLNSGNSSQGIAADSGHNGKVEGRVVGEGTDIGIANVKIELIPHDNIHGACPDHPIAYTDDLGYFTFSRVYYGLLGDDISGKFKVVATLENHGFNKDTTIISGINLDNPNNDNLKLSPIQDTTTFFINGLVYQEDLRSENQINCGVSDVQFYVDDGSAEVLKIPTSADDGAYAVDIATIGTYDIRASLDHHSFEPAQFQDLYVNNDVSNVNFKDTSTNVLSGSVRAACGFIFGSVELLIEDTDGCFVFRDTTDASGNISSDLRLPARQYNITVTDYEDPDLNDNYLIENIKPYFDRQTITADLDTGDIELNLVYRQGLSIDIEGIEANACGDYIFDQLKRYPITIRVKELNTQGCDLDTGSLIIIDHISGREQAVFPISQGKVEYTIAPGDPNFSGDYTKLISFTARHIDSTYLPKTMQVDGIITGYKSREATFTTVSPEIPFLILRDPPGDQSYAYFQENTSTNLSLGISVLKGGSVNVWNKARLGSSLSISAPLSPVSFNTDVWGEIGGSTTVGFNNTTTTEGNLSFSHYSEYKTSALEDPSAIGQNADVYVGAAMSLRYSKADILEYDFESCSVLTSEDLIMGDAQMQTEFAYSEFSILNSVIPSLESNRDESPEQADKDYYQDQIDLWNQMLDWNAELKEDATINASYAVSNSTQIPGHQSSLSWSGGGSSQTKEMTTTASSRLSFEFNLEIDKELSAELGYNVAGTGSSGGVNVRTRFELGVSSSVEVQKSRTTGFVLSDNDPLDRFETTVYNCPVYGTPIFKNEASITSCPYETGSSPIDGPVLSVEAPIVTNIAPDGNAGFTFLISNQSQDEKTRSYTLDIVQTSNPHNANINTPLPIHFVDLAYGSTQPQFISISRVGADPNVFSYEGLEFILTPMECDANGEYATSTVKVSAYFDSECSDIDLAQPEPNWITNGASDNIRRALIKNYTESDLSTVSLQYTPTGINTWLTAVGPLSPMDLNDNATNGTYIDWDLNNVEDGSYDLRLRLTCSSGSIYTERVSGVIDRTAPVVHGFPMPLDDIYDPSENDLIGVKMNENINCDQAVVEIVDLETQELIPAYITCSGRELVVNPIVLLENRTPSAYRVILNGVNDIYGNTSEELRWVFIVGDYVYDPDCSPIEISNNNLNQDAISQSIYRAMQISSDGMITDNHTIGFKAEESITLMPGFEVSSGGALTAEIENCEDN